MNYGLPYIGSKNRIAKRLVEALPAAPVLYDVFCGGCAITHAALLSGKYSRVVANDINGMIPHAFETALGGGFRNEDRWISRDDFQRLYKTDPYVAICFSFGNNLHEYCYARDLEPYKRALHYAIFWKDTSPWRELCPETADALKKAVESEQDRKQRRIQARHFIVGSLERLQSLESLERLQSLECPPGALTVHSGDYRELCFDEPGIIYCDPPYKDTAGYGEDYAELFCHDEFYGWCEAQKLPVYISEYQMPEERFACIAEWDKVTTIAAKTPSHVTERLWRPRTQL